MHPEGGSLSISLIDLRLQVLWRSAARDVIKSLVAPKGATKSDKDTQVAGMSQHKLCLTHDFKDCEENKVRF